MNKLVILVGIIIIMILVGLTGCIEDKVVKKHREEINTNCWFELYEPIIDFSDLYKRKIPDPNLRFSKVDRDVGVGDQIFLFYRVEIKEIEEFKSRARCIISRIGEEELEARDPNHPYAPCSHDENWFKYTDELGFPEIPNQYQLFKPGEYTFIWSYKPPWFGNYSARFYIEGKRNLSESSLNFTVKNITLEDNRWALIICVDPPGKEIYSWMDGLTVFNTIHNEYDFPRSHIIFLSNAGATRENVLNAMEWISSQTDRNSKLVFWYSGHGDIELNGDNDPELIDGVLALWNDQNLYDEDVAEFFAKSKSMHILSVVDSDYSGEFGGPDDTGEAVLGAIGFQESIEGEGRICITSATTFTRSYRSKKGGILTTLMAGAFAGIKDGSGYTADDFPYGNGNRKISVEEAGWWTVMHCRMINHLSFPQLNDCYRGEMYLGNW
jgi:hypothetical protein